jgi:hypothetical protein
MQDDEDKGSGAASGKQSRRDRLKHALRENLKRRKAQARGRNELSTAPTADGKASLDDAGNEASD